MSTIDVNSVLAQIRSLSTQVQAPANAAKSASAAGAAAPANAAQGFGSLVGKAIDQVNSTQQTAATLQNKFELGDPSVELSSVMLATSKAQVEFRAMVEVRNRLVSAYQDIMNMPI
jgi:flagellar hook-basal body complex protein FliE